MEERIEKGGISVATEHIFPVIKKWLYSEKEIFLREIVSNACDAITKLKRLEALGQYDSKFEAYKIDVKLDKNAKTVTVSDNGIGMSADEVKKYICSIALSGALDFIKKYEDENSDGGIIGHFGLGFYSSFMVSSEVEVITRSIDGSDAVRFICNETGEYTMEKTEKDHHGTDVIMHINSEGEEYLSEYKLKEILDKYCAFMPVEIYLTDENEEKPEMKEGEEEKKPAPINDTTPLWLKNPSDCSDEEYREFYKKVFRDYREPLFWIHINADYPLNFKGILYFPKIASEYESIEGQVKLYYNQVFVADNIKEVIPEYLLMLKGVLDCPELPLNVSRSYLQNSGYVSKISAHIVKKTADKLNGLFNTERERFEEIWKDIKLLCEYGCLKDRKFFEKIKNSVLLEKVGGGFVTVEEYKEASKETNEGKVYYATDAVTQAQYISLFEGRGIGVVLLDKIIDTQFVPLIEEAFSLKFMRIDSDVDALKDESAEEKTSEKLEGLFKEAADKQDLTVKFETLVDNEVPAILNISEESRRMADMMKMYGMAGMDMPEELTLIINLSSDIIKKLEASENKEAALKVAHHIYSLALMSQRPLSADEMKEFIKSSLEIASASL